jgi:UDP-N-acetylglucosamine acyltransferase
MIHPSALIDSTAIIGSNVEIGAYTVIGANVSIGDGTIIGPHVGIKGTTRIGKKNRIYQFASVGEDPQDKKYAGEDTLLEIGDSNVIREFTTINRGTTQDGSVTRIGDNNLLMAYTHVAHDCLLQNDIILANAASLAGHVHVDSNVILGGFTIVHQFCHLGKSSFTAMGSAITKDLPPYIMVGGRPTKPYGINSVGLERSGYSKESIKQIKSAYKVLYKSKLKLADARDQLNQMSIDTPEIKVMVEFLDSSSRSILR